MNAFKSMLIVNTCAVFAYSLGAKKSVLTQDHKMMSIERYKMFILSISQRI